MERRRNEIRSCKHCSLFYLITCWLIWSSSDWPSGISPSSCVFPFTTYLSSLGYGDCRRSSSCGDARDERDSNVAPKIHGPSRWTRIRRFTRHNLESLPHKSNENHISSGKCLYIVDHLNEILLTNRFANIFTEANVVSEFNEHLTRAREAV